jgi:hypothetical protein
MTRTHARLAGYSMAEVLIATAVAGIVLTGAVQLFNQGVDVSYVATQRGEMQQNSRVALNLIARDLGVAGTGVPMGGVSTPTGSGVAAKIACDMAFSCYIQVGGTTPATYSNTRVYAINPGNGLGPTVGGVATDTVTIIYKDANYPATFGGLPAGTLDQLPVASISNNGDQVTFAAGTNPPINDPAVGLNPGDCLLFTNFHGAAIGVVTTVNGTTRTALMAASADPLSFNQHGAPGGNIQALANTPGAGDYPLTQAFRAIIVSYYIDATTTPNNPRLMRQVNALAPVPVAENIDNLQFSYDIFDEDTSVSQSNLDDPTSGTPPASPNQIRKVNVSLWARSASQRLVRRGFSRLEMATSVHPRNLSFRDRYQ